MNLVLRPLSDINDPTWSVIISLVILLAGVFYVIVYIIGMANNELNDVRPNQSEGCEPGSGDSTPETQD